MNDRDRSLLAEMRRGARLIFENAEQLYKEAQLLGTNGAFARALCLHQISLEECSKLDMIGAAVMSLFMGHKVDVNKLMNASRQHKVKNYNAAYLSKATEPEIAARKRGAFSESLTIFTSQQKAFHDRLNNNKNASLYVDYRGGRFTCPSQVITEEMAVEMQALNAESLKYASLHVALIDKMTSDAAGAAATAGALSTIFEQLKNAQPSDLEDLLFQKIKELAAQLKENRDTH